MPRMAAPPGAVTDLGRIHLQDVTVESGGTPVRAHLARPAEPGVRPGIVVVQEAHGLNEHIRDVANRFANLGFDAIAPDLYTREGAPAPGDTQDLMRRLFGMPDARVLGDLEACAAHLRALDSASGKVGCIGFCVGGRFTLMFACRSRALDAAVDCWGGFVDRATPDAETSPERPVRVVDMLDGLCCPIHLVGGAEDQNPSPQLLEEIRSRLAQTGQPVSLEVYENAGHAFFADYRPNYREEAAHRLWPRVVEFFDRHLR